MILKILKTKYSCFIIFILFLTQTRVVPQEEKKSLFNIIQATPEKNANVNRNGELFCHRYFSTVYNRIGKQL